VSKSIYLLFVLVLLIASSLVVNEPALSSAEMVENSWVAKNPIPVPEGVKKAATVNGKIYVMGSSVNYEYDPATDNWTAKASMPTPRAHFGIAVYNNKIFTFGGWEASETEVYGPATNTWEIKTPLPSLVKNPHANVIDNEIYVMSMNGSYCYNVANDSWSIRSNAPHGGPQTVVDGKIYAFYGDHTDIYDPKSDSWIEGTSIPISLYQQSVCATTGVMSPKRIYLFGGKRQTFDSGTNITQVYDPKTDTWSLGEPMPTERSSAAIAVVNDQIYVIGGYDGMYSASGANERYTPFGYGTPDPTYDGTAPEIVLKSPKNVTYYNSSITLEFSTNESVSWIGYKLDNNTIVEVTGNTAVSGLSLGSHSLTIYATDIAGNTGSSETVFFSVAESFPVVPLATAVIVIAVLLCAGLLLFYFKNRKH
jgi:N-acetylneuraminic acid mutarotase